MSTTQLISGWVAILQQPMSSEDREEHNEALYDNDSDLSINYEGSMIYSMTECSEDFYGLSLGSQSMTSQTKEEFLNMVTEQGFDVVEDSAQPYREIYYNGGDSSIDMLKLEDFPTNWGKPDPVKERKGVYIAGPMSGYDNNNHTAFMVAQSELEGRGVERINIFNPAISEESLMVSKGLLEGEEAYRVCLDADLQWICQHAVSIYMLRGWENSKGARAEHALAVALGIYIEYEAPE